MLNPRQRKILQLIIEDYISTAEPVASRTIARKHDLGISPATIRNEMSDLELLGYLEQPHTSAGRVPSSRAYRFYVDSLVEPGGLSATDRALINSWYKERRRNLDDIFQSTAKLLSRMTNNVSLVLADKQGGARFLYLRFLPLDGDRAILCVVADDGSVDNCMVDIPLGMGPAELDYLAGRVSRLLEGRQLNQISDELLEAVHASIIDDEMLFSSLAQLLRRMGSRSQEQKVFLGGTKQLLNQPEFRDMERVKELLGLLEEEKVVRNLLQADSDSGLKITIGKENKLSGIQDCSMVQATYRLNGRIVGTMAVLGPTRMEYGKVIAVMDYLHRYLKTLFETAQ